MKVQTGDIKSLVDIDDMDYEGLLYFPPHINRRITAQQSCFTVHRMPKAGQEFISFDRDTSVSVFSRIMRKLVIPAHVKKVLRNQLDQIGVNYLTIFPDLDGLSKKLEWKIYNHEGPTISYSEIASPPRVITIPDEFWDPRTGKEHGEAD